MAGTHTAFRIGNLIGWVVVALLPAATQAQLPVTTRLEPPELPHGAILVPGNRLGGGPEPSDPPVPLVALRVRVAALAAPGQDLEYRLLAENLSRSPAHHVLVRYSVPANAEFVRANPEPADQKPELVWRLGTLKGGERKEIVVVIKPTGEGEVQACARVQFEHGECVRTRLAKPGTAASATPPTPSNPPRPLPTGTPALSSLRVRTGGPTRVGVNDLVSFWIDIANTGSASLADVVVTDKLPDGLDFLDSTPPTDVSQTPRWDLGALGPGQTRRIAYRAVAKRGGSFTNHAEVTAAGGIKESAEATVAVDQAKLAVELNGPHAGIVGRPATYVVTVTNQGSAVLKNVRIRQDLIREMRLDSSAPQGRIFAEAEKGEQIVWQLGDLAPGAKKMVQLRYTAAQAGTFDLWVTGDADRLEGAHEAYATTRFRDAPKPAILVDKRGEDLIAGVERTLTVWVVNLDGTEVTNLQLTLTLPEGMVAKDLHGASVDEVNKHVLRFKPLPVLGRNMETALGRVTVLAAQAGVATLSFELRAGGKVVDKEDEKLTILRPRKSQESK
jgi:uncharacterized repeat protein (TIGR01451 family)